MESTTPTTPENVAEFAPEPGSRNGWNYSSYARKGRAKVRRRTGGFDLYGVYGVRRGGGGGLEFFGQYEGGETPDGAVYGLSLLASSCDSEPYIWQNVAGVAELRIF